MTYLVNESTKHMQNTLVSRVYKEKLIDELLSESPEIATRRKRLRLMIQSLKRAKEILSVVEDYDLEDVEEQHQDNNIL